MSADDSDSSSTEDERVPSVREYNDPLLEKQPGPTSIFPDAIDGFGQIPLVINKVTALRAEQFNSYRSAIINIELTLGAKVQGDYRNVRERLEALEARGLGGLKECCDLQATTDAGNVTTNGVVIGRIASAAVLSNIQLTTESLTLLDDYNGVVVGPFSIGDDTEFTIPSGSVLVVM
tara:strand:- start:11 stop:541 length:531 start_codon:yes stop_codon:yes gene_type:complete